MELPRGLLEKPPQDAGAPGLWRGTASGCSAVAALGVTQKHVSSRRWCIPLADASLLFVLTSGTPSEKAPTQVPHVAAKISSAGLSHTWCQVLCSSVPPRQTALRVRDMGPPCRGPEGSQGQAK